MTEYLVIDQLQEHSAWDNDGQWMEGYRVEGDFEVYADYSVKETVRTDTVGATRIEINTYFLDTDGQYRDMFTYGHGQLMRTMDWSGMPDGPEVQAVRDFLMWYHRSHEAIDTLSLIDYHEKYYAVDRQACRAFVDRLAESDRVSPDYLARWEAYFEKYDSYFQKEQVDDGPPPGFDHDLILQTQEPRQALAVIPQDLIVTKLIRRGEDRAEVTVDLWTSRITYTLSRREDRWLIDGQE